MSTKSTKKIERNCEKQTHYLRTPGVKELNLAS